jgi:hypothetical protein
LLADAAQCALSRSILHNLTSKQRDPNPKKKALIIA